MKKYSREQMIEMALKMRGKERFDPITEEEFALYQVTEQEMIIPTTQGDSKVFLITPSKEESDKQSQKALPLIINFHGGGFIKGRLDRDKLFCYKLAHELTCIVMDVDYKLAPEYRFPVAVNESYEVVKWAFENAQSLGVDKDRIALIGHSAGGNLAVQAIIKAGEENTFIPKCLVLDYPPLDLYTDPDKKRRSKRDLPSERARIYNSFYCDIEEAKSYRVSPIFAPNEKLAVFPPTLVITAGDDSLCQEGEQFAMQLVQAGVEVLSKRFLNSVHGFTINRRDKHQEAFQLIKSTVGRIL